MPLLPVSKFDAWDIDSTGGDGELATSATNAATFDKISKSCMLDDIVTRTKCVLEEEKVFVTTNGQREEALSEQVPSFFTTYHPGED